MRRLLGAGVLGLLVMFSNTAVAFPGAFHYAEQMAYADWIEMKGSSGILVGVVGARGLDPDGDVVTVGAVFRGTCTKSKHRRMTIIICTATGRSKKIPITDFSMHPAMDQASVSVKMGGHRHSATWTGRGQTPTAGGQVSGGDGFVAAGADVYRDARTTGKVYGKRMVSKGWLDLGFMWISAQAFAHGSESDGLRISVAGDRLTVTRTIEIPR